jgi:hypothetical protein
MYIAILENMNEYCYILVLILGYLLSYTLPYMIVYCIQKLFNILLIPIKKLKKIFYKEFN